jgi:hypothetical protein
LFRMKFDWTCRAECMEFLLFPMPWEGVKSSFAVLGGSTEASPLPGRGNLKQPQKGAERHLSTFLRYSATKVYFCLS